MIKSNEEENKTIKLYKRNGIIDAVIVAKWYCDRIFSYKSEYHCHQDKKNGE